MAKRITFYKAGSKPVTTSDYVLEVISTPKGKRKRAVNKKRKLYQFVTMDFKK